MGGISQWLGAQDRVCGRCSVRSGWIHRGSGIGADRGSRMGGISQWLGAQDRVCDWGFGSF